jgi:hypothetical protein
MRQHTIINAVWSSCKVHITQIRYWSNLNFLDIFRKILKYQISWKFVQWSRIVPCGRKDSETDMTKLIVGFRNFANAPKTWMKDTTWEMLSAEGKRKTRIDINNFHVPNKTETCFSFCIFYKWDYRSRQYAMTKVRDILYVQLYRVIEKDGRDLKPL